MSLMNLKVSDAEKSAWKAAADKEGLSLSAWLRSLASAAVSGEPTPPKAGKSAKSTVGGRFGLPGPRPNADSERESRLSGRGKDHPFMA